MKKLILSIVLFIGCTIFAQAQPNEKQKQIQQQFNQEVQSIQNDMVKQLEPYKAQIYDITEQMKFIEAKTNEKIQLLKPKYDKLFTEASKENPEAEK